MRTPGTAHPSSPSPQLDYDPHTAPATEADRTTLLYRFESCTLPRPLWTHAAHLVVGTHYIHTLPFEAAMDTMRLRVRAFNLSVGTANTLTGGYHETLTRLWLLALAGLRHRHRLATPLAFAALAVQTYGGRRDLHRQLYSIDIVHSPEARQWWLQPDLPDTENILPTAL